MLEFFGTGFYFRKERKYEYELNKISSVDPFIEKLYLQYNEVHERKQTELLAGIVRINQMLIYLG